MAWKQRSSTDAKYRTPEHRRERARLAHLLRHYGYLTCAQPVCVEPSRIIQPGTEWHVGHDDAGTSYIGAVHATCNVKDAAIRARAKQVKGRRRLVI